jgi:hypothetical protein
VQWLNTNSGRPTANRMGLPSPALNPPTQACQANTEIPVAVISSPPDNGAPVSGTLQILGVASAPNFGSFTLDYAPVGTQNFQRIVGPVNVPRDTQNSVLADWNTTNVPNGQYTLLLRMNSANGVGFIQRQITVTVQNQPTPTPTVPIPPTSPPVLATDTTIPLFPSATFSGGGAQIIGEATATPTITLGG